MFNDQAERDFIARPTAFYVGKRRKDEKYLLQFCYYARRIGKLCTAEEVAGFRADPQYKER